MFANVTLSLMGGFVTTVQLFCLTLVFALPLGLYQLRLDEPHLHRCAHSSKSS